MFGISKDMTYFAAKNYPSDGLGAVYIHPSHYFSGMTNIKSYSSGPVACCRIFPSFESGLEWIYIEGRSDFTVKEAMGEPYKNKIPVDVETGGPAVGVVIDYEYYKQHRWFKDISEFSSFVAEKSQILCGNNLTFFYSFHNTIQEAEL